MTLSSRIAGQIVRAARGTSAPLVLASALALGCGAGAAQRPVVVPVGNVAAPPGVTAGARRGPSEELKKRWSFTKRPRSLAYVDVRGLLRTDLGRGIVPELLAIMKSLTPDEALGACLRGASANLLEAAMGFEQGGMLVVARYDATSKWSPRACLKDGEHERARIAGAEEAFVINRLVVAFQPGFVFVGSDDLVTAALAGKESGASFGDLGLGDAEYATWNVDLGEGDAKARGSLMLSPERFRVALELDLEDERTARQLERAANEARTDLVGKEGEEAKALGRILGALDVKRTGRQVSVVFELREPPREQVRDLGTLAALGTFAVRRYLVNAKAAEARNTVGQIARDIAIDWEREDGKPRSKRRLVSYPAVPKAVPRGVKYASTPADWKPWAPLRFAMEMPQYFQYEVRAVNGGEGAEVIAHGDLNGDGKVSTFKMEVRIDRNNGDTLLLSPSILEQDPEE
jgi:type IV pilus assembly protein PilA